MCDCLWFAIGVCNNKCSCEKYLSMNSEKGRMVGDEWALKVEEVLKPLAIEFAKTNGFE